MSKTLKDLVKDKIICILESNIEDNEEFYKDFCIIECYDRTRKLGEVADQILELLDD